MGTLRPRGGTRPRFGCGNRAYTFADDVDVNIDMIDGTSPCATDAGSDSFAEGFGCNNVKKNVRAKRVRPSFLGALPI